MKFQNEEIEKVVEHIKDALRENASVIEDEIKQAVKDNAIANQLSGSDSGKLPFAKVDICMKISPVGDDLFIESSLKISHSNVKKIPLDKLTIDNQPDMFTGTKTK